MSKSLLQANRFKKCIVLHLIVLFLIGTFLSPLSRGVWDYLDAHVFHFLNSSLAWGYLWGSAWAVLNHSLFDWVGDVVMLALFSAYIFEASHQERIERVVELVFSILYIAALIFFVNRLLFRENLEILRDSPTLAFSDSIRLSEWLDWIKIKDTSTKSFPGDHATTAIAFAVCLSTFARGGLAWCSWIYATVVSLPRLIIGAHWFSDVVVGSGVIVLLSYAWVFCTPLRPWAFTRIRQLIVRRAV